MKRDARWFTAACAVTGLLYGLLAPKWYRSVLAVVPAKSQKPSISTALGADLSGPGRVKALSRELSHTRSMKRI